MKWLAHNTITAQAAALKQRHLTQELGQRRPGFCREAFPSQSRSRARSAMYAPWSSMHSIASNHCIQFVMDTGRIESLEAQ
jgi:hypothetical protein